MLTLTPARRRRAGSGKLGIALAGGGPLGSFYELGALHALEEGIIGRELTDFDVYVGVSSGSFVAAGLANGFDTAAMGSMFIENDSALLPLSPGTLLQPAVGEYLRRLLLLPKALGSMARQYARDPLRAGWPAAIGTLAKILPTALFDNKPPERYLRALFGSRGHTDDFRRLRGRLYVVATNLNTGESVALGDSRYDHVPISRAVVASAALPGLYAAVTIDGQPFVDGALIRTMHASLALEAGCELVICINPLVPFDASRAPGGRHANLADEGLPAILGQTFRALIHSRMQLGMTSYRSRFPHANTILLEPDRDDERLFFTNVFRYSGRQRVADHAYQQTRRDLLAQADALAPVLSRCGLRLDTERLRDPDRSFSTAARERAGHARRSFRRLEGALDRLESIVSARGAMG
jgi:predicted acylesterase/phospholipase RssA